MLKEGQPTEKRTCRVAFAGNPNVGKSTLFNALTGMHQHTGNWTGKTVGLTEGLCRSRRYTYRMTDIPGTYSLRPRSAEEEIARNFLCFSSPDAVIVVCDATCLARGFSLLCEVLQITPRVLLCVNLMDEAKRKGIAVDTAGLSAALHIPVVATNAQDKRSVKKLLSALDQLMEQTDFSTVTPPPYPQEIEAAILPLADLLAKEYGLPARFLAARLIEKDFALLHEINLFVGRNILANDAVAAALASAKARLSDHGIDDIESSAAANFSLTGQNLCKRFVSGALDDMPATDKKIDALVTGKYTAVPIMLLLLCLILWLTIFGANAPSAMLADFFAWIEVPLYGALRFLRLPAFLCDWLIFGALRVLGFVVSVMLPPMAIFFPLFSLLEDVGLLPRIAYNLDRPFQCAGVCGKQSLTMCMGLGCNAVGVTGCRIIDGRRDRLIAILTNCLVPCNGRFPTLILLISLFFVRSDGGLLSSLKSAALLTLLILLSVLMTFALSFLLSKTLLRGKEVPFTLELPAYRKPSMKKILVRSFFDRILKILGRVVCVALPCGLLLWPLAHFYIGETSALARIAGFFAPFGRFFGLDGAIITAFLLGLPANEIVLPIVGMIYAAAADLAPLGAADLRVLLLANGWTARTAACCILFSLFHFPCATTLWTIQKETGSTKWTVVAFVLPTLLGLLLCRLMVLLF